MTAWLAGVKRFCGYWEHAQFYYVAQEEKEKKKIKKHSLITREVPRMSEAATLPRFFGEVLDTKVEEQHVGLMQCHQPSVPQFATWHIAGHGIHLT